MNNEPEIENALDDMLDVTVCLTSFRRPHYLPEAIDSVLAQTRSPKEFIILDNGSGAEFEKTANRYKSRRVIFEGTDVPMPAVWNFRRAIDRAQTKYLNIMHDDDRMCPDFLEKQVGYLEDNPDVAGIFCNCHLIDPSGRRTGVLKPFALNRMFKSSAEVAFIYARGSCIPFPTGVYRVAELRQIPDRKEYGKVADVVFMCDLADNSAIAYQRLPLYEYRIHDEQDSTCLTGELTTRLDKFMLEKISERRPAINRMRWHLLKLYLNCKRTFMSLLS